MKDLIVKESIKCLLFLFTIIIVINFMHKRRERVGNQFSLDESVQIYHRKNYSVLMNKNNQGQPKTCPLYSTELGKK
jgi:hypothetical protein